MDELPPIRDLSLTQRRIREALKNAPPLTITKKSNDLVVFDNQKKDQNWLFNRFLRHKTMSTKNCPENNDPMKSGYKWSQLKDIMTEELETKRMESQKYKDINNKIENEELDDVEDELETLLNKDVVDSNEDKEKDSESNKNDISSDEEDVEEEEGVEELSDNEEEEEESERELNPFFDDEAKDDEEVKSIGEDSKEDSDDSRDSFVVHNQQKHKSMPEEETVDDNDLNDSPLETSFNIFDESFERKAATQKIALSPFITQKPKPRFEAKRDFSELVSDFNLNNEEFNSQSLLDLCSGNFEQNNGQTDCQTQKELENSQSDASDNEDSDQDLDDTKVLNRSKKVFNIESDNESEDEDKEIEMKTTKEVKSSLKSFNESDGEELVVTDEEEIEEDDDIEEHNINAFFDDEAELSGSDDVSSDEDDAEDEAQEEEGDKEDLPSDSEMEEQNKKYFNKQILDEEKRNIMIWKERLFEDGDLHDDGQQRQKKFRWNLGADDNFINDYVDEDSDDNYLDSDEDEKTKTPTLKIIDKKSEVESKVDHNLDKFKSSLKNNFDLKSLNKNIGSEAKSNSISAFIVRDKRLNTIMSIESKRSINSKNKSNKKLKTSKKETKTSIFDLLNPNN